MAPVVTQVLLKKNKPMPWDSCPSVDDHEATDAKLDSQDVAGFFIFLAVVFTVLMIALYA